MQDLFKSRDVLKVGNKEYVIHRLDALEKAGLTQLGKLPYSIRIVLEAALRQCNDKEITQQDVKNIAAWAPNGMRPYFAILNRNTRGIALDLWRMTRQAGTGRQWGRAYP